ncbi:MAG: hypothetical protein CVU77_05585, partial [Elusimicrobia bacterium HGW-Elusimicrobia-1]
MTATTNSYQLWTATFTAWTDGYNYSVESRAFDKSGIYSTIYSSAVFTYDQTPPTSRATLPAHNVPIKELVAITGTASDLADGKAITVNMAVKRNTDGKWFDYSDFNSASVVPLETELSVNGTWWQYAYIASLASKLSSGVSYYITSQANDAALPSNNYEQWAVLGTTFTFDNSHATTTVILPAHNLYYNTLSQIQGTARDATSAIDQVKTAIQRLTDGKWWNPDGGGSWDDTTPGYNPVWINVSTSSLINWTLYSSSVPPSGQLTHAARYNVIARSLDRPGNVEDLFTVGANSVTFTWDVGKPTSVVTVPVNNEYYGGPSRPITLLEGTASDAPSGLSNVKWAMGEAPTGPWWYLDGSTFSSPSVIWYNADGLTPWSAATPPLQNSRQYIVRSKALDNATNEETPSAGKTFTYDNERPVSGIVRPVNNKPYNALVSISGTAADNTANNGIMVSVRQVGGSWFNNVTGEFTVGTEEASWFASSGTAANWYYYGIPWASGHEYLVRSRAFDRATNEEIPLSGNQFKFDSEPPTSSATYPEAGVYYSVIPSVTGTAVDTGGSGVQKVEVRIKNVTDTLFWNGSNFVAQSSWVPVAMHVSSWSYSTTVSWNSGRVYQIASRAWDVAGSSETAGEIPDAGDVEFFYDDTKPVTKVLMPVGGDFYKTLAIVSGTAADPMPGGGTVASGIATSGVDYAILNKTISKWWSGGAFNDNDRQWFAATGEADWQFAFSDINWDDASVYLITTRVRDKAVAPNYETAFTVDVNSVTFTVDKSTPVSYIRHPSGGLVTNSLPSISGTALDVNTPSSGIDKVEVAVRRDAPAPVKWWTGAVFDSDVSSYVVTQALTPNNTFWWYTGFEAQLVTHSTYTVFARAVDKSKPSGNYEITGGSRQFVYDITKPTAVVVSPSANANLNELTQIIGTAFDVFGIVQVRALMRDLTYPNTYWNGTSWQVGEPATWPAATGGSSWTYDMTAFSDGHQYQATARAYDTAGNTGNPSTAKIFKYDTSRPVSRVTLPVNDGFYRILPTLSGTALDPDTGPGTTGIGSVKVLISKAGGDYYQGGGTVWSGTVTELPTTLFDMGAGDKTGKWRYDSDMPVWEDGVTYTVQCKVYDKAGNAEIEPLHAGSTFKFDSTPPDSLVNLPENIYEAQNRGYASLGSITGTAVDANGIMGVKIKVYDESEGLTWNDEIGNWDSPDDETEKFWTVVAGSGTGTVVWSTSTVITWTNNKIYRIVSRARDYAANYEVELSTTRVKIDDTSPTAGVTQPSGNNINSLPAISGTARDVETRVLQVRVRIRRQFDGKYWSFTGWQTFGDPSSAWINAAGNGTGIINWAYTHDNFLDPASPDYAWTSGRTYTIDVEARDPSLPAPNIRTVTDAYTFTFDRAPPVARTVLPASNGAYNSLDSITGTAMDLTAGLQKVQIQVYDVTAGATWYDDGASKFWSTGDIWVNLSTSAVGGSTVTWSYVEPALMDVGQPDGWKDGRTYRVRARAYDQANSYDGSPSPNVSTYVVTNQFIFDVTKPTSTITIPEDDSYNVDITRIYGTSADTFSGVGNSGVLTDGAEVVIVLDADENDVPSAGDYIWDWNGSSYTWVDYAGSLVWRPTIGGLSWYSGDVMTGKWRSGKWYLAKARAKDLAGNVQDHTLMPWKRFSVTLPAKSFNVTALNTSPTAGTAVSLVVEAKDQLEGGGDRARNYRGRIRFTVDGSISAPGEPEIPYVTGDEAITWKGWLPADYRFTEEVQGATTFSAMISSETLKLVKTSSRRVYVTDIDSTSVVGFADLTVSAASPEKLRVRAPGSTGKPGTLTGLGGSPSERTAGVSFSATVEATDRYWNIAASTSTTARLATSDVYATSLPQDKALVGGDGLPKGSTTYDVTLVTRGNPTLTASDIGGTAWSEHTSGPVPVAAASVNRLMVLAPGQTPVWGKPPYSVPYNDGGRSTTTATVQTAGVPFTATVFAVDNFWNRRDDVSSVIRLVTSDTYDIHPTTTPLSGGSTTFVVTMIRSATQYLEAGVFSGTSVSSGTSNGIFVRPNPTVGEMKLQVLVPGETRVAGKANAPESLYYGGEEPYGKAGTPDALTAGSTYQATVNLVDRFYNIVTNATMPKVNVNMSPYSIEVNPISASLVAGTRNFGINYLVSTSQTNGPASRSVAVTDSGETGTNYTADTSPSISVVPASISKLQLLVPTESAAPGTAEGKSGSAQSRVAGISFNVTVRACDDYWNHNTAGDRQVKIISTDQYAAVVTESLPSGVGQIIKPMILRRARPTGNTLDTVYTDITARDDSGEAVLWSSQTVSAIEVNPDTDSSEGKRKLQIVMPGQTAQPGHPAGITGNITPRTAGSGFSVTINSVDSNWNRLPVDAPVETKVTLIDDNYAVVPTTKTMVAGQEIFTVTPVTAKQQRLKVEDVENPPIPPTYVSTTTVYFTVNPAAATRLQVLVPNQQNVPGKWSGSPTATEPYGKNTFSTVNQTAGAPFNVTVNACDSYWNITSTNVTVDVKVVITAMDEDPYGAVFASTTTLVNSSTFTATAYTAATRRLRVQKVGGGLTEQTGEVITIEPKLPASKLLIFVAGESHVPGKCPEVGAPAPYGRSGTPTRQTAGQSFGISVAVTDDFYNRVTNVDPQPTIRLSAADPHDRQPPQSGPTYIDEPMSNGQIGIDAPYYWYLVTASTSGWSISADDISPNIYATADSQPIKVKPAPHAPGEGKPRKLLTLLPGETLDSGKPPYDYPNNTGGKSGAATARTAGADFTVTAHAVDHYWNVINDALYEISPVEGNAYTEITTTDLYDSEPGAAVMVNGTIPFGLNLVTASTFTLTVTDIEASPPRGYNYQSYTTVVSTVQSASAVRLQALLPGESALPGSATGKTGNPTVWNAGQQYYITVNGTDQFWNRRNDSVASVRFTATGGYETVYSTAQSLISGTAQIPFMLFTASTHTILAEDIDAAPLDPFTVPVVTVTFNSPTKLLAVMPGETYKPGRWKQTPAGKEGAPNTYTAGEQFTLTVYGVDTWYNKTSTTTSSFIETTDPYDVHPATANIVSGQVTFNQAFVSATDALNWNTSWTLGAKAPQSNMSASTVSGISVAANAHVSDPANRRLIAILPGQTYKPGKFGATPYGLDNSPSSQVAGSTFTATVYATDNWWNRNSSFNPTADLTTNDPNDTHPSARTLAAGATTFPVTLITRNDSGWTVSVAAGGFTAYNSADVTVQPNTASKLLVLLPGQSEVWGTGAGRSGEPDTQTAGSAFVITVKSCDAYYNFQPADTSSVSVVTSDLYDNHPSTRALIAGVTHYTILPVTASTQTITALDRSAPFMADNISDVYTVDAGTVSRLQVLLPGETSLPGSSGGKQGTPQTLTAGVTFYVTVNATDASWNAKAGYTDNDGVRIETTDSYDIHPATQPLANGTTVFAVTLVTRGSSHRIYAIDTSIAPDGWYLSNGTSTIATVNPKIDVLSELRLQLIVPGETAAEGKWNNGVNAAPYGKIGAPTARTAGTSFNVIANLVDRYWNRVDSGVDMQWVGLEKIGDYDQYAVYPSSRPLVGGTTTFPVEFRTSGFGSSPSSWTLTLRDVDQTTPDFSDDTSPRITVNPGTAKKYLIITPGETWAPGKTSGKAGKTEGSSVNTQVAGSTFTVTLYLVDDFYNAPNQSVVPTVVASDPNCKNPPSPGGAQYGLTGGVRNVDITLVTASTEGWTVTASGGGSYTEYVTPAIKVNPAGPSRLLALLPGESHAPGTSTGKTGEAVGQTAGTPFAVTVLITDNRWNLVTTTSAFIGVSTEDPYDVHPASASTDSGVKVFWVEFQRGVGEAYAIKASTAGGNNLASYVTPAITSTFGSAVKLQLLVPGETSVPGHDVIGGKSGLTEFWTADTPRLVTVNVVDKYWNKNTNVNTTVRLTSNDPFFVPPDNQPTNFGSVEIWATLITSSSTAEGGWTITASTAAGASADHLVSTTSPKIRVQAGTASKILVMVPGEEPLPGSSTGKQGSPSVQTAGDVFLVTAQATDSKWNPSDSTATVRLTSNDGYAPAVADQPLVGGATVFSSTLITGNAGALNTANRNTTVTVADVTSPAPPLPLTSGNSVVPVKAAPDAVYLLMLMPGQTHVPGRPPYAPTGEGWYPGGASGTPSTWLAGTTYYATIAACDKYW